MRAYIKKLQQKEESKRKQIFAITMIVSMSLVASVWFYSLGNRFGNPKIKVQANEDVKPFKLFSNSLTDTIKNIGASVGNAKVVNETPEVVPQKEEKQIDLIPIENNNQ